MENSISIKQMTLINFKGIRKKEIEFDHVTNIFGDNGTGKTTLFDAFTWLLFGKDSTDRQVFEIKTLDKNNNVIPKIDHEVSALLDVSGEEVSVKRVFREKWVKKKGSLEQEFSGHETQYYWNDVPKSQKEFQDKIASILAESVFKLITNPLAFNSLKWTERRNVLVELVGHVRDEDIASGNAEFEVLMAKLTNKSLEEYKKQLAAQRKKMNDELKVIPTRIDEVSRNTPEALDFAQLNLEKERLTKEIEAVESQINDESKAYEELSNRRGVLSKEIFELNSKAQDIKSKLQNDIQNSLKKGPSEKEAITKDLVELNQNLESCIATLKTLRSKKDGLLVDVTNITSQMDASRNEWNQVNAETLEFNEGDLCCPTCKRYFEKEQLETKKQSMLASFKANKESRLKSITQKGLSLKSQKENIGLEINKIDEIINTGEELANECKSSIDVLQKKLEQVGEEDVKQQDPQQLLEEALKDHSEYQYLLTSIQAKEDVKNGIQMVDNVQLKEKKSLLNTQLQQVLTGLNVESQIAASNKRKAELEEQETKLAQEISDLEKDQFVIENFENEKANYLEQMVNRKFSLVNFKLFETQINGAEVPCCHTLIDGVPFSDANTASKINAGLDIINTLCDYYKITAPIFIDNRESVVNILSCQSQIINLIVSEADKSLRIERSGQQVAVA